MVNPKTFGEMLFLVPDREGVLGWLKKLDGVPAEGLESEMEDAREALENELVWAEGSSSAAGRMIHLQNARNYQMYIDTLTDMIG